MALSRITEAVASFTDLTIGDDLTLTDDLLLASDAALIKFGADADVIFTHVADTGLLLNSASVIQFRDSAINIGSPADGDLDINADDEIELNSTLIDVNGNLDVSGTIVGASTLSATTITASTAFVPDASDGAALGTTALEFSDLFLADAAVIALGADQDVTLTHVADTGVLLNAASVVQFRDSAINIGSPADGDLDINADDEIELNSTLIDVNGNLDVSGTIVGASTLSATTITASTAFVPDASDGAALGTTALEFSDLFLADAAVINLGADQDVTITHVADTGVLINGASVVQFRDSAINIGSPADGDLDINADDEIELNSTLIDINGNVEISGTAAIVGIATFTDDIIIGDGKTIGSASDVDAITIGSDGDITLTQDLELQHDGAILSFGANDEIALTHVHDTGLLLTDSGGTPTLQLHNASESVSSDGSKLILTSNGVAFSLPTADGSANQVLATNGSAVLSFADNSGGQLIQTVNTTRVDVVSGTTTMPFDDTIPQKTEGVEFLTVAITPTKNDNKLLISVHLQCQMTNNGQWSMALFQDDTADALAASSERDGASDLEIHSLKHFMTTGTTSETTFKIRSASSGSGTITMNSVAGSRKYGGVLSSSITVQEIEV